MYEKMIESSLLYIEDNIMSDISLKEISEHFNISSFHFSRIFAFMIGEPYRQYILKRKVSHSLVMLDCKESIINTAYSYGFAYPESYSRAFKKIFGISPKKYQSDGNPVKAYERGKVITRDLVNFKGEIFIRCEYEYCQNLAMFGDKILINKSNPKWMEDAYESGDRFLNNSKDLKFLNQDYYYNEIKCIEYGKLYYLSFMKSINRDLVETKADKLIEVEGGWFAKFHYNGRVADIYDCLEADIMKWIEKKDEKLEYIGNGILLRYDLSDLSEFDILVRLNRKMK